MPFSIFSYEKPPTLAQIKEFSRSHLEFFAKSCDFDADAEFNIILSIAQEVINNYLEDMDRYTRYNKIPEPNVFKKMGHLAFWIRKLKPIASAKSNKSAELIPFINETFAVLTALFYCDYAPENPQASYKQSHAGYSQTLTKDQWNDLLVYLRYRSVSPHSLMMILSFMHHGTNHPS